MGRARVRAVSRRTNATTSCLGIITMGLDDTALLQQVIINSRT
jgi:hypothetical protein